MKFIRENKDNKVQFIEQKKIIYKGSVRLEKYQQKKHDMLPNSQREQYKSDLSPIIRQKRAQTILKQLLCEQNQQVLEAKSSRNFKLKKISVDYNYQVKLPNIEEYFNSQDKFQYLKTIQLDKSRVEKHLGEIERIKKELDFSEYVFAQHHSSNTPSKSGRRHTLKLNSSGSKIFGKTENIRKQLFPIEAEELSRLCDTSIRNKEIELYKKYEKVRDSKALPQLVQQINESYEEKNKLSEKFNRQLYYCIHNRDYSLQDKITQYKNESMNYTQFYNIQKKLKQNLEGRFKATDLQIHKFQEELKKLAQTSDRPTESRKQKLSRIKVELENGNYLEHY